MTRERTQARAVGVLAAVAAIVASAALAPQGRAAGSESAVAQGSDCPRATAPAVEVPRKRLRRAVRCVVNEKRDNRGRRPLRRQGQLQGVAQRHAKAMVRRECLKPRCPGQPPLHRRIRRSGYVDDAKRWEFALNTGCARTARAMVRKWKESRYHRRNMMRPRFRHIGVGVAPRATHRRCKDGWATFAALFAWRVR